MARKQAQSQEEPAVTPSGSVLDSLRHNQVGGLFAGLIVALAAGLLLSVLVPSRPHALALVLLGLLLAAAVGFTVRYLSLTRGLLDMIGALALTALGVHVMIVTGTVGGGFAGLEWLELLGAELSVGFNDALVAALATPAASSLAVLAGVVAALIVGWGPQRLSAS